MVYNTVILDADNTLFDFDRAEHEALRQVMTAHGYPFTPETEALYLSFNRELWTRFDQGRVTQAWLTVERFRRLNAALGGSCDPEAMNAEYLTRLGEGAYLLPGAEAFCRTLSQAGVVLAIATNGVARVQRARLSASPLAPYFPHLFISEELGAQKPLPAFFTPMLNALKVTDRGRCLMVGDNLLSDIKGGQDAGLDTAWYNPHHRPNPTSIVPTYTVENFDSLLPLILLSSSKGRDTP